MTGTTFTDSGLVGDGSYTYTVRSVDLAGNESVDSVAAVVVYDTTPPVAPAITATAGKAAGTAALTWSAAADAGSGVVSYEVRRSAANGAAPASPATGTPVCGTPAAAVLSCTDVGLTPGASYRYSVFAVDAVGNVSAAGSSAALAIPAAADTTPPKAPTAVKDVVSGALVTLSWKNPKADLAKVVVVWNATRAPRSSSDGTSVYKGTGSKFAVKLSKLPAGKKVHFAVFALDKAGNASRAASATVTVPGGGPAQRRARRQALGQPDALVEDDQGRHVLQRAGVRGQRHDEARRDRLAGRHELRAPGGRPRQGQDVHLVRVARHRREGCREVRHADREADLHVHGVDG